MGILKKRKKVDKETKKLQKALKKEARDKAVADFHYGKEHFSWVAPEHVPHQKGEKWYLIAVGLLIITVILSLLNDSWTFALVLLVIAAIYYIQTFEQPKDIKIIISELGIKVGRKVYPYRNIKAFWMYYYPGHIEVLNILTTDKFFPEVSIQLNGQEPGELRNYLVRQIPEWEGKEESFTEVLIRLLRL